MVNILKLGLVKILTLDLVEMLMFGRDFEVDALSRLSDDLNPRVRCAFGNVFLVLPSGEAVLVRGLHPALPILFTYKHINSVKRSATSISEGISMLKHPHNIWAKKRETTKAEKT